MIRTAFIYILGFSSCAFGQAIQFEEILPQAPTPPNLLEFDYTAYGEMIFFDADNDGDQDAIITGSASLVGTNAYPIAMIYLNDGLGNYSLNENVSFERVTSSSVNTADVDNDGDIDVLLSGSNSSFDASTILYINDGIGGFSVSGINNLEGAMYGKCVFQDLDNDNDFDLLITGFTNTNDTIANIYFNDGNGLFTLDTNSNLNGVMLGDASFSDVDGDNNPDLILTGLSAIGPITKLYLNNGSGTFTEDLSNSFPGLIASSSALGDLDNDLDNDLIISGKDWSAQSVTYVFKNNGSGNFTLDTNANLRGMWFGDIAVEDYNGDGSNDVLICGQEIPYMNFAELYWNDGTGNFTLDLTSALAGLAGSHLTVADVENDGDLDFLYNGHNDIGFALNRLYINDGNGVFRWASRVLHDGVDYSSSEFGDIDGDGDKDLIFTGVPCNVWDKAELKIFKNDGTGNFTKMNDSIVQGVFSGDLKFLDVENDGDLDLLVTGAVVSGPYSIASLYLNDGFGNFSESPTSIAGVVFSDIAIGDVDNDMDVDLIVMGRDNSNQPSTRLYLNNGSGVFTFQSSSIVYAHNGAIELADLDADNDLDIVIAGSTYSASNFNESQSEVYLNNGNGVFTENLNVNFVPVREADLQVADIDNDGDKDVIIAGNEDSNAPSTRVYLNDGLANFIEQTGTLISGVGFKANIALTDFDNDNAPDLLIMGYPGSNPVSGANNVTELYKNNGLGYFTQVSPVPFDKLNIGSISVADVDGDGKTDIFLSGYERTAYRVAKIYRNSTTVSLDENLLNTNINIYPNPTSSILTISGIETSKIERISIIDIHGQQLLEIKGENIKETIDVSDISSGFYFLSIDTGTVSSIIKRWVKE